PSPRRLNFSAPWRALEASRRLMNVWIPLWFALQNESELRDETRLLILRSLWDHGEMLHRFSSFWGGNHLITEKTALVALATAFPEFNDAREWLQSGTTSVIREYRK